MRVQATQRGYYGGKVREVDEEFAIPEDTKPGAWMKPLDGDAMDEDEGDAPKPKAKGQVKETEVKAPVEPAKTKDPVTGDDI